MAKQRKHVWNLQTKRTAWNKANIQEKFYKIFKSLERNLLELELTINKSKQWKTDCWSYLKGKISGTASTGSLQSTEKFGTWAIGGEELSVQTLNKILIKILLSPAMIEYIRSRGQDLTDRKEILSKMKEMDVYLLLCRKVEMQNTKKV